MQCQVYSLKEGSYRGKKSSESFKKQLRENAEGGEGAVPCGSVLMG